MNIKFSVLISVYHKENALFLEEALTSIEEQTLSADEIVLVRDGPLTSELDSVIMKYTKDSKIPCKVLALERNLGLGEALNEGLKHCSYDWIARMDTDDISMPERFRKQIIALEENPDIDVLGSWISEFYLDPKNHTGERRPPLDHLSIVQYAKYRNPINHMTAIFRKDAVETVGGYQTMNGFEDYYLWIRMLQKGYIFKNLDEVLVKARAGNEMILRRQGWGYVKNEWNFLNSVWRLGFLSTYEYIRNVFFRSTLRILPVFVLKRMYNVLRKT